MTTAADAQWATDLKEMNESIARIQKCPRDSWEYIAEILLYQANHGKVLGLAPDHVVVPKDLLRSLAVLIALKADLSISKKDLDAVKEYTGRRK